MLTEDQFGIIQNHQIPQVPQTSCLVWTFLLFLTANRLWLYRLEVKQFHVHCSSQVVFQLHEYLNEKLFNIYTV